MTRNVDGVNTDGQNCPCLMRTTKKSRSEPRAYHHGDLRAALLAAATKLLAEGGVAAVTLRECARRVGVSHAAPQRHFPTKEALVAALAEDGFAELRTAGEAAMQTAKGARARLDAYGVAYVRFALDHPERFRLMFTSNVANLDAEAPCANAAYELLRASVHAVVGDIDDLDGAAAAFWSLPHGLAMLILDGRIPAERLRTPRAVEELARASFRHWRSSG